MSRRRQFWFALAAILLVVPETISANHAGGASLQIPPAVRSEGMGRAYAPLEISPFAAWANPGALGFVRGIEAATFRTRLVPDLAPGVHQNYQSVIAGVAHNIGGTPVNFSLGFNHTRLDYGFSLGGTISSFETTDGLTAAVGIDDLVGVGFGVKRFHASFTGDPQDEATTTAFDYGILARTPLFPFRDKGESRPIGASLTAGVSLLNRGSDIEFNTGPGAALRDPLPKVRRESIGLNVGFFPAEEHLKTSNRWLSRIIRDKHLISFSGAIGREKDLLEHVFPDSIRAGMTKNQIDGITTFRGAEVRFLDTLALRIGRINDETGQIIGETYGWGFSLLGLVGVDYARIPQFRDLEKVAKWAFWVRVPLDASF